MCARKPALGHRKQQKSLVVQQENHHNNNHHHHHYLTGEIQLVPSSVASRLERIRKRRRQLRPNPCANLQLEWAPPPRESRHASTMDMSNEINENLSNEVAKVKGCHPRAPLQNNPNVSPAKHYYVLSPRPGYRGGNI